MEHIPNPIDIVNKLIEQLEHNGILVIEGPIETNVNIGFITRWLYFKIRKLIQKSWVVNHPPTHQFFSNSNNQQKFFKQFTLNELHFEITEASWPFPSSIKEAEGTGNKIKSIIAKFSILISSLNKNWGNTFIYVGRKK